MRRVSKNERARVSLTLNGRKMSGEAEPRMLLSDFLRHVLGATGTHVGCEHGVCGCCTVLLDGTAVRSCLTLAVQAENRAVATVESMSPSISPPRIAPGMLPRPPKMMMMNAFSSG